MSKAKKTDKKADKGKAVVKADPKAKDEKILSKEGSADSKPAFDPATATCDVFGMFDPTSRFCGDCPNDNAAMAEACKAVTATAKAAKPKATAKRGPAKGTGGKGLSIYGHRPGTQAAHLDDLFAAGATIEGMMEALGVSKARVTSHQRHLLNEQGMVQEILEGGAIRITPPVVEDEKDNKKAA